MLGAALVGVFTHIPVVPLLLGYGDYLADLEAQIIFVGGRVVVDGLDFVHGDGLQWWMQVVPAAGCSMGGDSCGPCLTALGQDCVGAL